MEIRARQRTHTHTQTHSLHQAAKQQHEGVQLAERGEVDGEKQVLLGLQLATDGKGEEDTQMEDDMETIIDLPVHRPALSARPHEQD